MPDIERVIHSLEYCACDKDWNCECNCPYADGHDEMGACIDALMRDALALLKAQEPAEPEIDVLNEIDRIYRCPNCHKAFFYEKQKYCDACGQAVKWE